MCFVVKASIQYHITLWLGLSFDCLSVTVAWALVSFNCSGVSFNIIQLLCALFWFKLFLLSQISALCLCEVCSTIPEENITWSSDVLCSQYSTIPECSGMIACACGMSEWLVECECFCRRMDEWVISGWNVCWASCNTGWKLNNIPLFLNVVVW